MTFSETLSFLTTIVGITATALFFLLIVGIEVGAPYHLANAIAIGIEPLQKWFSTDFQTVEIIFVVNKSVTIVFRFLWNVMMFSAVFLGLSWIMEVIEEKFFED